MSESLRSSETSRPGPARASLEALRKRWGVVETWPKEPHFLLGASGERVTEWWTRIGPDLYVQREVTP